MDTGEEAKGEWIEAETESECDGVADTVTPGNSNVAVTES